MNKLTKLLSVFVIAGAMAGTGAALSGCSHKHTYSEDWSKDADKHWHAATCEHSDEKIDEGAHADENQDGKCDSCGYNMVIPQAKYSITYNVKGHGTAPANVAEATNLPETLPTLTEEGWTFGGWFTDEGCNTAAVAGAKLTSDITLYAKWTQNQGEQPNPDTKYSITYNVKGHGTAPANIAEATNVPETLPTLTEEGWTFGGWFTDEGCNTAAVAGAKLTSNITLYAKWTQNQGGGEQPNPEHGEHSYSEWTVATPPTVATKGEATRTCKNTTGTCTGAELTKVLPEITAESYTITAGSTAGKSVYTLKSDTTISFEADTVYETVTTRVDFVKAASANGGNDTTNGSVGNDGYVYASKISFASGARFEPTSTSKTDYGTAKAKGCVNTQGKIITITLTGAKNAITIWGEGASSSSAGIAVHKGDSTGTKLAEKLNVGNGAATGTIELTDLEAGTYTVVSTGSIRLYDIAISEDLAVSEKSGIEASGATAKFLKGRLFDYNGLTVMLNYENGRKDAVEVTADMVDSSAVDMNNAGKYTVKVKYDGFEATYEIAVYEIESITLEMYDLNGQRITKNVQQVFASASMFNSDNLGVVATASCPGVDEIEIFVLSATSGNQEYTIAGGDTTTAGKKTITVTATDKQTVTATYEIQVVSSTFAELSAYEITVDQNAVFTVDATAGTATVNTLNQALQLLKLGENVKEEADKTIKIKKGEYKEKVEIDIPNVHLIGDLSTDETMKDVVIWYDALALTVAHGGVAHSTDGSATVSVRSTAEGFSAKDITFKNYYNTNELYQESKKLGANTQAVALLADCDKVTFENCYFTSYHDTLYAMNGRQVYENCEIEGRTDYIFGDKATAYFHNCTINTIGADDEKNGGYIVATKGSGVKYGYIFDGCSFGADEHVVEGTVSLARGWDKGMQLMFMNSSFSKAYSHEAYGNTESNKNDRYTKMNAEPVAAQLFEYNNTGDGALTAEEIATADATTGIIAKICTIPTKAVADTYADFNTIFAMTNGTLTYKTPWAGTNERVTLTVKSADNEDIVVKVFKNVKLTEALAKSMITIEGKALTGLYTDSDCTAAFDYSTQISTDITLHATFKIELGKTYYYAFGGTNSDEWVEDRTQGTIKSSDATPVEAIKLVPGTYLVLNAKGNKATLELTGFTTGSSKASEYINVEFLDAGNNVLKTVKGTTVTDKKNGDITFASATIELESQFVSIRITSNTAGKSVAITSAKIYVEV